MIKSKHLPFKLSILSQLVVRTPVFNLDDNLSERLDELKCFIQDASPNFHKTIRDFSVDDLPALSGKVYFTMWKYFNRGKYRAIPFGRFASVTILTEQHYVSPDTLKIILEDDLHVHALRDWGEREKFELRGKSLIESATSFINNTTIYPTADGYRYIGVINGIFELGIIGIFDELKTVIEYCGNKRSKEDLFLKLTKDYNLNARSITDFLAQLTDLQLLWSDRTPNITGIDYFSRMGKSFQLPDQASYKISRRKHLSNTGIDLSLELMTELLSFLNAHLPYHTNNHLDKFRMDFLRKFDRQAVPLSIALDPELGIGYANLESGYNDMQLSNLKSIFNPGRENIRSQFVYNPFLLFVLSKSMVQKIVSIEEYKGSSESQAPALPNSFSVLYQRYHGAAVVQHIGGCTANALLGRFTPCDNNFKEFGREIANLEQKANPNVVFFDVAYQFEKHVDNINRREQLYPMELPLFTWSTSQEPLSLEDIYVCVQGNSLILYSKKLKKRLVPRIPTAYNYSRSDLGIYRFLSDLQHQHLRSDLTFPMTQIFPEQAHYSRIVYKTIILSPETWLVPQTIVSSFINNNLDSSIKSLVRWLDKENIEDSFQAGQNDQKLTFNTRDDNDLIAFIMYCRQNSGSTIYISEALIDPANGVQNEDGKPFNAQFLRSYYHNEEIYTGHQQFPDLDYGEITECKRIFTPGSEWLYFEIYCHPARANEILKTKIAPWIHKNTKHVKKWFFLRYTEPKHHIRLRFKLKQNHDTFELIKTFNSVLEPFSASGVISDIQIKSYMREIERYGRQRINEVERFFWQDSIYVVKLINRTEDIAHLYTAALRTITLLTQFVFPNPEDQVKYASDMSQQFSKELQFNSNSYKALNRQYELFRNVEKIFVEDKHYANQEKAFKEVILLFDNDKLKVTILADLIHMHINRLFPSHQRKHEAILYQYLLKDIKRYHRRSTNSKE
jgi:thiopeptide-type bacteriocin biosynthesis protein